MIYHIVKCDKTPTKDELIGELNLQGKTTSSDYIWDKGCAAFIDAVAYSSHIERDAIETRKHLASHFEQLSQLVTKHGGEVIDTAGDGVFAEFAQPSGASRCLLEFQEQVLETNASLSVEDRWSFRSGVSYGPILREEARISGPTVNIAARLQQQAEPATTLVCGEVHSMISTSNVFRFTDLGFRVLKGISNPVRLWQLSDAKNHTEALSDRIVSELSAEGTDHKSERGIAVLPFEVPKGGDLADEEDAWVALGLAADVADGLARSRWLNVISPRSSMNYSDASYTNNRVAQELGVRYLLKGRIRKIGSSTRVTATLIDCTSEFTVWSQNFDHKDQDFFQIQDEITRQIVGYIEPEFLRHEAWKAAHSRPRSLDAWELLMRARWHYWRGNRKSIAQAMVNAEKALQLDPENGRAYALLASCHMVKIWTGNYEDFDAIQAETLRLARLAVRYDEMDPNAHFTLGTAISLKGNMSEAIAAERHAIELNPNSATAMGELARMLVCSGEHQEARVTAARALKLSPTDPHASLFIRSMAIASMIEGKYEEAQQLAFEAAAKRPNWYFHQILAAVCQALAGDVEGAKQTYKAVQKAFPIYPIEVVKAGHPFTNPEHMDIFLKGLKLAGWVDETPK